MSAPNQVIVTNNSGVTWTAAMFLHSSDTPLVSSFASGSAYGATGVASPGGTFGGSVQVDKMERDYWMLAIVIGGPPGTCFAMCGGFITVPYKECDAPEDGWTGITVAASADGGSTYPVTITTYEGVQGSNGHEDSQCSATMLTFAAASVSDPGDPLMNALSTYLSGLTGTS